MDGIVVISILLLGGLLLKAVSPKGTSGMNDTPVSIDNVRRGVANGWYKAMLARVNEKPAVFLYGKNIVGQDSSGYYPISEADWQTLKNEGYSEIS